MISIEHIKRRAIQFNAVFTSFKPSEHGTFQGCCEFESASEAKAFYEFMIQSIHFTVVLDDTYVIFNS